MKAGHFSFWLLFSFFLFRARALSLSSRHITLSELSHFSPPRSRAPQLLLTFLFLSRVTALKRMAFSCPRRQEDEGEREREREQAPAGQRERRRLHPNFASWHFWPQTVSSLNKETPTPSTSITYFFFHLEKCVRKYLQLEHAVWCWILSRVGGFLTLALKLSS